MLTLNLDPHPILCSAFSSALIMKKTRYGFVKSEQCLDVGSCCLFIQFHVNLKQFFRKTCSQSLFLKSAKLNKNTRTGWKMECSSI